MRTIKFRGKNEKNGEWEHGFFAYLHIPDKIDSGQITIGYQSIPSIFNDGEGYREGSYWKTVVQKTVGQFTGIFDKKGKEIYEGDLLSTPLSEVNPFGMVAWHPNGYFFIDTEFGKRMPAEDHRTLGEMMNYMIGSRSTEFEVIGNIHDNPELLKGGAK